MQRGRRTQTRQPLLEQNGQLSVGRLFVATLRTTSQVPFERATKRRVEGVSTVIEQIRTGFFAFHGNHIA
jgi:hypothetical protein